MFGILIRSGDQQLLVVGRARVAGNIAFRHVRVPVGRSRQIAGAVRTPVDTPMGATFITLAGPSRTAEPEQRASQHDGQGQRAHRDGQQHLDRAERAFG